MDAHRLMEIPTSLEALRSRSRAILANTARHKASNLRVCGSVARRAAVPGSDLDFLVTMAPDPTLVDLIALKQEFESLLGIPVGVMGDDAIHPLIQKGVNSTTVPL